ncbi:hypothetical protein JQK15_03825 [Sphingobium sp. BHU LFT2]|uniref:hypothetical protein n=1 Tax=Sphingobium sp. BHU LFT2 TaxID=2807634 RepID=UPI001BEA2677|nr:hypothetical protein [Sphingobium sp. BHU LFT2]MBT2242657.1 hypothetical protein [Sphingobium sp. BHU LFT2]
MATRREILAATIAAPMIVAPAVTQAAGLVCSPVAGTAEWDVAFAQYQAAKDEDECFYREVYQPEMEPLDALEPPYRIAHVAKNGQSFTYTIDPRYNEYDTGPIGEWRFLRDEIEAAKEKCAAYVAAMPASRRDFLNRMTDELGGAAYDARYALFRTPAPNLEALEYKLRMLMEAATDSVIEPPEIAQIISDVQLIAGNAGGRP